MKPGSQRLPYLDWVRGLSAIVMLQGHVFDSFLRSDLRQGGAFQVSQFAGGMPPAVFLFLLGVTFAFLMDSQERKGVDPAGRWRVALKRSGYLFAAAFAFRFQLWLFSADISPWTDLLRVDILNCMGMALLVFSVMAVFRTSERIRLCAILGAAIAMAAPVISNLSLPGLPALARNYIVPDHLYFGFFPWASFVAFGMSAGSILRIVKPEHTPAMMQWFAWGGLGVAFTAYAFSNMGISIYTKADFWLNSPALIFIKLGAVLILIAFAWLWNLQTSAQEWSWVREFGLTSLLVYWVHIELIYGRWLAILKQSLTIGQTIVAVMLTILLMLGLSLLRTNRSAVRGWLTAAPRAERVPGD